jgi:hypothetical protein
MLNWYDVRTGSFDYATDSVNNPPVRSDVYVLDSIQA